MVENLNFSDFFVMLPFHKWVLSAYAQACFVIVRYISKQWRFIIDEAVNVRQITQLSTRALFVANSINLLIYL